MECNLVWNHTRDFKIERARSASSIWNHKYDFRAKLHDPKFNYHIIKSILKSHNLPKYKNYKILVSSNIYWNDVRFVKKKNRKRVYILF